MQGSEHSPACKDLNTASLNPIISLGSTLTQSVNINVGLFDAKIEFHHELRLNEKKVLIFVVFSKIFHNELRMQHFGRIHPSSAVFRKKKRHTVVNRA